MRSRLPIVTLLIVCAAALAQPQPAQTTPAYTQFTAWLAAFNQGGDTLRQFLERNYPARMPRINGDLELRERTGGFELMKIEESSATSVAALVQERASDQIARIMLEVAPEPPYNIVRVTGQPVPRPAEFPLPHLPEKQLLAELHKRLAADAAADRFSGAALVARSGSPVFAEALGFADRASKKPNTIKTRFRLGSMNKMFTAVATLQLVQSGKLELNAPIGRYLTDYPNQDVASKVTIHHLLTHTGGTGDFFGPEFEQHRLELRTINDYIKLFGARGLAFEPGSKWEYSNYGFLLLGARTPIACRTAAPPPAADIPRWKTC